jgi:nitroreductase
LTPNSIIETIKSRRSVRYFEEKPIPADVVNTLLEAATYAPTGLNQQPWKFTLITNKKVMKKLSDEAKPVLYSMIPDIGDEATMGFKKMLNNPEFNIFYNSPLVVVIAGMKSPTARDDCAMAAQNMMLAAHSLGLGSCWVGSMMGIANDPAVKMELAVPHNMEIFSTIIFGYAKTQPKAPPRKEPEILKRID